MTTSLGVLTLFPCCGVFHSGRVTYRYVLIPYAPAVPLCRAFIMAKFIKVLLKSLRVPCFRQRSVLCWRHSRNVKDGTEKGLEPIGNRTLDLEVAKFITDFQSSTFSDLVIFLL